MRFIFQNVPPAAKSRRKTNTIQARSGRGQVFTVRELRKLAVQCKIPNRSHLNKAELAEALDRHFAAARIWIAWSSRKRARPPVEPPSPPQPEVLNNLDNADRRIDPITLEPLELPIFIFELDARKQMHYSLANLLQYLSNSKVFKDPVTGIAFSDVHLREMDRLAHEHGIKAPSVLLLSRSTQPALVRQQQSLIAGIERITGGYIEQFRQIIQQEPPYTDPRQSAQLFNTRLHREFLDSFRQLRSVDREAADIAIQQWSQFLIGPPNNPNPDPANFLQPILRWLQDARQQASP